MTGQPQRIFVADANVFIAAHRSYYAFNLCPGFWDCLIHFFDAGRIVSIDRVRDELVGNKDKLSDWVENLQVDWFVPSLEETVTDAYREVMSWVYANVQFYPQAKDEFSRGADGWLVAYAREHSATLVTLERYAPDARRKVPLPNVCDQFGVARTDTFEMLGDLGVHFNWRS